MSTPQATAPELGEPIEVNGTESVPISTKMVDPETGEVFEIEEFTSKPDSEFSDDYAHWVLRKAQLERARIESAEQAVTLADRSLRKLCEDAVTGVLETAEARALQEQITLGNSIVKDATRRLEHFTTVYQARLVDWVKPKLSKSSNTLKTIFGSIQFKNAKIKYRVSDAERAVEWAKASDYIDAVKVEESLLASKLPDGALDKFSDDLTGAHNAGFAVEVEPECVVIKGAKK